MPYSKSSFESTKYKSSTITSMNISQNVMAAFSSCGRNHENIRPECDPSCISAYYMRSRSPADYTIIDLTRITQVLNSRRFCTIDTSSLVFDTESEQNTVTAGFPSQTHTCQPLSFASCIADPSLLFSHSNTTPLFQ